jgi:ribosomal protein S1
MLLNAKYHLGLRWSVSGYKVFNPGRQFETCAFELFCARLCKTHSARVKSVNNANKKTAYAYVRRRLF